MVAKDGPVYATIVGSIVIAGALGWLTAHEQSRELLNAEGARLQDAAGARTRDLAEKLRDNLKSLDFVSQDESFLSDCRRAAAGNRVAEERASRSLEALRHLANLSSVEIRDALGRTILSAPSRTAPLATGIAGSTAPTISGFSRDASGRRIMDFTARLPSLGKGAVLVARSSIDRLAADGFAAGARAVGVEDMLLHREGDDIVFWSDFPHAPAHRRIPMATPGLVGARALRGERGLLYGVDYKGTPVIAFAEGVPDTDWVVVARLEDTQLLRALRRRAVLFTLGFAALGLLTGLGLIRLLRGEATRTRRGLSRRRALLLRAVEQSTESVVITDAAGFIEYVNPAFTRATGYTRSEILGKNPSLLKSGRQSRGFYEELWATLARGEAWHGQFVNQRKDGTLFHEDAAIAPVRRGGKTVHYIAVKRDVSRERRLAEQFLQAQKMEPLGLLAGGVAHDINNLLTAIVGYGELIASGEPPAQTVQDAQEILRACTRAAALTRQLLSFGRRGAGKAELLDLNAAVASIQKLLRRVLRENIALRLDASAGPAWALIDPNALDQAILNLVINARDAMPDGGTVTISVDVTDLTPQPSDCGQEVIPGLYARLSVADTGIGMSPEVKARIFEPFFTTKPAGQGTGLGLAVVRTVADDAGGRVCVESAPGRGTTFRLYLPLAAAPSPAKNSAQPFAAAPGRGAGETVLIVEDDDDLRRMIERVLKAQGYTALACRDAETASAVEVAHRGDIHVALCDVVLPGMDGRAFAASLRLRRPTARVVLMSGHAPKPSDTDLLVKPFTMAELCRRVYDAVGAHRAG